jgi:hypothetical protein
MDQADPPIHEFGVQMPSARLAQPADLASLLDLYRVSEVSPSAEPIARAEQIWQETLADSNVAVFVSALEVRVLATCMLITAPNLAACFP